MCNENEIKESCNCGGCCDHSDAHSCGSDCGCGEHTHDGITLSPKYGINATVPVCFFCKEEKDEIAALGLLPGDVQAPKSCILNYEPCNKCKENFSNGRLLIGVSKETAIPNQMEIAKNETGDLLYPTGNWVVLPKDAPISDDPEVMSKDIIVVDDEVVIGIIEASEKAREQFEQAALQTEE